MQQFTYLNDVFIDSITIGIVAFAISVSMAKILAKKHDYEIEPNQVAFCFFVVSVRSGLKYIICSILSKYYAN